MSDSAHRGVQQIVLIGGSGDGQRVHVANDQHSIGGQEVHTRRVFRARYQFDEKRDIEVFALECLSDYEVLERLVGGYHASGGGQ